MDLVTLATLCVVGVEPRVMHALAIIRSDGKPWSFRGDDGVLRSFEGPREAAFAARQAQGAAAQITVGLAGLPVNLGAATAQPNAGLFEPCVNLVLASLRLDERARTCAVRMPEAPRERCALATFAADFETPDWRFADAVLTLAAGADLANPANSNPCETPRLGAPTSTVPAPDLPRAKPLPPSVSRSIFVPLSRDRR